MEIKDRIQEFIDYKGFDTKAFEREIGVSNGLWAKAKTLSEDVLLKIIKRFPQISPEWILTGKGDMYIMDTTKHVSENDEITLLRQENDKLHEELERLENLKLPTKDSKVYNLWMKFMEVTEEMSELYKEAKGK